ncbi:DUF2793 domain-containing protein [Octadecabacter sp. G9-8]|uniref:DUF2793 domain-containing protein n=1 Tax=Octadecabacter dasysiphoniae TaxID=2909341 RepID=A0ABS9CWI2_9RHOB|nr:DUF2793 domain-containing protein [Octadecabacter dasysiphoniae]MCF2871641.1 DUF2793 domain-containing protein [Octadecabacter dasysiphoniae]
MSQSSHILGLPYIQPAQAQKHVTHNEAIRVLDALVQLSVVDRDQTTPPATAVTGDRHIVPAGATGEWAGQDGSIAVFEDAAWAFYPPQDGWQSVVRSEGITLIWNGSDWVAPTIDATAFQNLDSVGVNTTADATNRLAVASDATLLSHAGTDHRVVVNKNAPTDTASLLFQTGYSGRAEMGTAGSDDFAVKVSADAATWNTGVSFDATTGRAEFPSGAKISNRLDVGGRVYCYTDGRWVTHNNYHGTKTPNISATAGTGADPTLNWDDVGVFVEQGYEFTNLVNAVRSNNAQLTNFDLRVYFQTGPWDVGFSADADVTRTLIGSADSAQAGTGFDRVTVDLGGFVAPADGFLLFYWRPIGTLTSTRYLYSSMIVNYLTPA